MLVQIVGVSAAAIATVVGVRSYILSNRRAEEAKSKEQETRDRELETRQAQLFMQVFSKYHEEEFWKNYLIVMSREWKSYEDWKRDRSDLTLMSTKLSVGTYLEGVGVLVKRGLLSPGIVADILGSTVVRYWSKQAEYVREFRVRTSFPEYYEYVEYLYDEVMKLRPPGYAPKVDYRLTSSTAESQG